MASLSSRELGLLDAYLYQARHFTESLMGLQMDARDGLRVDSKQQQQLETDLRRTVQQIIQLTGEET